MPESVEIKLARIEERLNHMGGQISHVVQETEGMSHWRNQVEAQAKETQLLRAALNQIRGMAVIVSACVAVFTAWVPGMFFGK